MTYSKKEIFNTEHQELAQIAKALSHPARIAILEYLAEKNVCISGDITNEIPLSRTTVSQHLQELKNVGLIKGSVSGKNVNYCICGDKAEQVFNMFNNFLNKLVLKEGNLC